MRIRVVDLAEFFGPAVHLRAPEYLEASTWTQLSHIRDWWQQVATLADGDTLVGDDADSVFGGAIVLLLPATMSAVIDEAIIVDGRQRLVAWQLLIDASRRAMQRQGAGLVARTLTPLLQNPAGAAKTPEQRRVVLPTSADRQEFVDRLTLDYALLANEPGRRSGIAAAHAWLLDAAEEWIGRGDAQDRSQRLARVIMHRLKVIVIEARAEENPLWIARRLTSGRAQLGAIRVVGQTLLDSLKLPDDAAERAYRTFMEPFLDDWWDAPADGALHSEPRHEQLLRAWVMARTLHAVHEMDLAPAFQRYLKISTVPPLDLLSRLREEGVRMRALFESAVDPHTDEDYRATFLYRMSVLGSAEAIAVLLWLDADERASVTPTQRRELLSTVESWVVRRALTGLPHSGVGAGAQALFTFLSDQAPSDAIDELPAAIAAQRHDEHYWPTDDDLRLVLPTRPLALELPESSARIIAEALAEDDVGYGAVHRGHSRVALLHHAPTGENDATPVLRHVLGNLALTDVWPKDSEPGSVPARTVASIERCLRIWAGPPNAVETAREPHSGRPTTAMWNPTTGSV